MPAYRGLVEEVIESVTRGKLSSKEQLDDCMDRLAVRFGEKILQTIPGRVSTEVDAHLSFDTQASIAKARRLIELYEQAGIDKSRVLIKMASTWEGIRAAEQLEKEGINCNLTLLFSFTQAAAAADAGADADADRPLVPDLNYPPAGDDVHVEDFAEATEQMMTIVERFGSFTKRGVADVRQNLRRVREKG